MKVLFINNYDMKSFYQRWKLRSEGAHHLWGATALLNYGIEIDIPSYRKFPTLNSFNKHYRWRDIDQEIRILMRRDFNILYSGS